MRLLFDYHTVTAASFQRYIHHKIVRCGVWNVNRCLWPLFFCNFATLIILTIMDMTMTAPVTFTAGALAEIRRLMTEPGFDTAKFLRVGVKGGGCSGLSYVLGFDDKQEQDEVFEFEGLNFIMNKSHGMYLMGMQIDWANGLNARGFTFTNPNASKTCGCGTSFAV
jgi:iron-sulfur cluster assembly protein